MSSHRLAYAWTRREHHDGSHDHMTDRCDPHLQIEVEVHEQRYGQNYGDARLVRLMLCEQHREAFDQRTRNVRNDGLFLPLQKQRMISATADYVGARTFFALAALALAFLTEATKTSRRTASSTSSRRHAPPATVSELVL